MGKRATAEQKERKALAIKEDATKVAERQKTTEEKREALKEARKQERDAKKEAARRRGIPTSRW